MVSQPLYPPVQFTVQQLANRSILNITSYVRWDPRYQMSIGSGASGDVYRGIFNVVSADTQQPYDMNVVVKFLRGTSDQSEKIETRLNREIACWRSLDHPNVARFLGVAYLIPNRPPGLVSKWVQRHNFLKYIGNHPSLKRDKVLGGGGSQVGCSLTTPQAKEIVQGLQYLHETGVIHGDLKVDNIIVSDRHVAQITDFGISQIMGVQGFTTDNPRNIRFTAPELMPTHAGSDGAGVSSVRPTRESDIFSLGILLLQLFHGPDQLKQRGLPYNHVRFVSYYDVRLVTRIRGGDRPKRERYNYMEDQHWRLLCWCWVTNPAERPTIQQVKEAI